MHHTWSLMFPMRGLQVKQLRYEQRLGEPKFEKVKRRLEEVKGAQRGGMEGTYRSSAGMDRQRQLVADIAIEKQLDAQSAFRTQGAYLQSVVNRMQAKNMANRKLCAPPIPLPLRLCTTDGSPFVRFLSLLPISLEYARPKLRAPAVVSGNCGVGLCRDSEIKQLQSWESTVNSVAARLTETHQQALRASTSSAPPDNQVALCGSCVCWCTDHLLDVSLFVSCTEAAMSCARMRQPRSEHE
jgi:hypothetical protein